MPKKKEKRVKTRYLNESKLDFLLAKSKIGNSIVRHFRRRKSGNSKIKNSGGSSVNLWRPVRNFLTFKKNLLLKVVAILLIFLVLFIGSNVISKYNSIKLKPYLEDSAEGSVELDYFGPEYNVLISGFKKISNNRFADLLILVSLNSKSGDLKILSINPDFITSSNVGNGRYTLKSLINNVGSENVAYNYSEGVESFMGVRIDRYISFDVQDFKGFLTEWNITMKSIDAYNSESGFYTRDSVLTSEVLGDYLFSDDINTNNDLIANRQLSFFNQFLQNYRNLPFYIKSFIQSEDLSDIFRSNMSKEEMSGFLSSLMSSNLPAKSGLVDSALGSAGTTGSESGIIANFLELDNRIKDILLNIDIVKEQVNIEIYNASAVPGYASKVKRIFQNMGANIINTNNYPEKVEGIKLFVPNKNPEDFPNNIAAIQYYFDDELQLLIGDYKYNHTADLILVLGG